MIQGQLLSLYYRCNYALSFALIFVGLHANAQSEKRLLELRNVEPKEKHDSIYYELFKLNSTVNKEKAIHYSQLAYQHAINNRHLLLQVNLCYDLACFYELNNQLDSSFSNYHKAIQASSSIKDNSWLIFLYNDIGLLHEKVDLYDSALHYFLLSYNLASENQSYKSQAIASHNIGLVNSDLENYPEATRYFKQAIAIKTKNKITKGLNLNYLNLARVNSEQGQYNEAIEHLKKVESNCKNTCDDNTLAGLNYSLGYANFKKGNNKKAVMLFTKALAFARKGGDKQWLSNTLFQLSYFEIFANNYKRAFTYLKEAEKIAIEINHRRLLRDVYNQLSIVYDETGDTGEARRYEKFYLQLKDSIFNKTVANNVKKIELKDQRKQSDIVIQQKETALWKSYTLTILLGLVFVLTCAVVYLVYRSLLLSRHYRKKVENEMLRMISDREDYQKDLFRAHMEFTSLLNRVTSILTIPISSLLTLANTIKNSLGSTELKVVNTMARLCTNMLAVLGNMNELILFKNHDVILEEFDAKSLTEEIVEGFKKINSFLLLTINIQKSVIKKIKSDRTLLLGAVNHAIQYFDHSNENPVVEIILEQFEHDDLTKITVKHYSTISDISIPYKNQFNHLTVMVNTGKLKGSFMVIQRNDYTLFEIIIPTDFAVPGMKKVERAIVVE